VNCAIPGGRGSVSNPMALRTAGNRLLDFTSKTCARARLGGEDPLGERDGQARLGTSKPASE
jgi:hypothetical protein